MLILSVSVMLHGLLLGQTQRHRSGRKWESIDFIGCVVLRQENIAPSSPIIYEKSFLGPDCLRTHAHIHTLTPADICLRCVCLGVVYRPFKCGHCVARCCDAEDENVLKTT